MGVKIIEGSVPLTFGCTDHLSNAAIVRAPLIVSIEAGNLFVDEVAIGSKCLEPVEIISKWIKASDKVLLAFDAPLGWPDAMGNSLVIHQAGQEISSPANKLFRRCTDDEIYNRFRIRPLEVGANLSARTAGAALRLLGELRNRTGCEIPLAWDASPQNGISVIEVYPAATLLARGNTNSKVIP